MASVTYNFSAHVCDAYLVGRRSAKQIQTDAGDVINQLKVQNDQIAAGQLGERQRYQGNS